MSKESAWMADQSIRLMNYFMENDIESITAMGIMAVTLVTLWEGNKEGEADFNKFVKATKDSLAKYKEGIKE